MGATPVHSQRRLIVAPAEPAAADKTCIALSFNGRTSDSDSLDRGSNPWGATNTYSAAVSVTGFESLGGNQHIFCCGIRHGVRIPGGQPTHILLRYPSRGSNPWGATNTYSAAVSVTGFESLGGNQHIFCCGIRHGVRIPGGQPTHVLLRYPSRGSNPWGATNEHSAAVSVTGFESLGGNPILLRYPSRGSNPWGATSTCSAAVSVTGFESLGGNQPTLQCHSDVDHS